VCRTAPVNPAQGRWLTAVEADSTGTRAPRTVRRGSRATWLSGLDGLRAVAVLAVLFFHAGLGSVTGGFLGVDVFFVISGFLITTLLLREHAASGGINLLAFWRRRARRLLPALFLVLAGVLLWAALVAPDLLARLRVDVLAAAGYVTNWYLLIDQQSYFEAAGRPSLLRHLWSLAVEEQFYLIWPVILVAALGVLRRRGTLILTVLLAAASVAWTAILFDPEGDPSRVYYGTDTRFFGLLIGASLSLVLAGRGLITAAVMAGVSDRARMVAPSARLHWPDLLVVGAVAALLVAFVGVDQYDTYLYPWGTVAVALVAAAAIAGAVHPAGLVGRRVLDAAPLRWLGQRSYGIYLWHWPVFMLTRPGLDVDLTPASDLVLRAAVTLALAQASYVLVEMPIRKGALGALGGRLTTAWRRSGRTRAGVLASAAAAVVAIVLAGQFVVRAPPAPPADAETATSFQGTVDDASAPSEEAPGATTDPASDGDDLVPERHATGGSGGAPSPRPSSTDASPPPTVTPGPGGSDTPGETAGTAPPAAPTRTPGGRPAATPTPEPGGGTPVSSPTADDVPGATPNETPAASPVGTIPPAAPSPTPATRASTPSRSSTSSSTATSGSANSRPPSIVPPISGAQVFALGDSVLLGAAQALGKALGKVDVDAEIGRQMSTALAILTEWVQADRLPDIVIVHVGNNGPVTTAQVNRMFDLLADVPHVVVLTVRISADYETHNNRLLTQLARAHPNVIVVDWNAISEGRPELFWKDGEHVRPEGAKVYAASVASALKERGITTR